MKKQSGRRVNIFLLSHNNKPGEKKNNTNFRKSENEKFKLCVITIERLRERAKSNDNSWYLFRSFRFNWLNICFDDTVWLLFSAST